MVWPRTELEEFFHLAIDLLCIVGFDGYFKRVNPSLERTLGYPRPELFSGSVLDITHPDDVQPSREALAQLTEGHDLVGFESRVSCAGAVWWFRARCREELAGQADKLNELCARERPRVRRPSSTARATKAQRRGPRRAAKRSLTARTASDL